MSEDYTLNLRNAGIHNDRAAAEAALTNWRGLRHLINELNRRYGGAVNVQDLIDRLRAFRDERNWRQFHTPKDLAISICVEAGELLEVFQWRQENEKLDPETLDLLRGEAADVLLYLLMLCDTVGIDLHEAAHLKIDKNGKRFPVATSRDVPKPIDRSKS